MEHFIIVSDANIRGILTGGRILVVNLTPEELPIFNWKNSLETKTFKLFEMLFN